jgi:folate-dependent phosphoribosylglycinamide formyltransferase PurN
MPRAMKAERSTGSKSTGSKSILCLISGRGSNLEALLLAARDEGWQADFGFQAAAVVSNRPDAPGLQVARAHGVPAVVLPHAQFTSREAFDAALSDLVDAHRPDLIVLAGFMRVLTPGFVARQRGRLINIHPSLLPAFAGLDTHRRALAARVLAQEHLLLPRCVRWILEGRVRLDGERVVADGIAPHELLVFAR